MTASSVPAILLLAIFTVANNNRFTFRFHPMNPRAAIGTTRNVPLDGDGALWYVAADCTVYFSVSPVNRTRRPACITSRSHVGGSTADPTLHINRPRNELGRHSIRPMAPYPNFQFATILLDWTL